jgi:ABC-2 type transport system ATP-binding protein
MTAAPFFDQLSRNAMGTEVVFDNVSKFYGEVLGVNRVTLKIPPGITALVGPNGSGKTTLMNLMSGLIFADRGQVTVKGIDPRRPELLMRKLGYCTQFDAAPRGYTGLQFVATSLELQRHATTNSTGAVHCS